MSRKALIVLLVLAAVVAAILALGGPPAPAPDPPGAFSFTVLGDAPYYAWEELRWRVLLEAIDQQPVSAVIHVGDIFWRPCTDEMLLRSRAALDRLRHPVIYTPGDNEWTDCWEPGSGAFSPRERLARLRAIFYGASPRSLGAPIPLVSQRSDPAFAEFVENVRWEHDRVVFFTVHLVGSRNATEPFPSRTGADDAEAARRLEAAVAWLRQSMLHAEVRNARAVVIATHGSLALTLPPSHDYRIAYEPFIAALDQEVARFGKPVLLVHGDHHQYTVDHPLPARPNFTRLEVPGSPDVGLVRVTVHPGARPRFTFAPYVVPRWKYW